MRSPLHSLGILLLPVLLALPPLPADSLSADGLALLAFKSAVTDDPSSALSSWSDTDADPCRWEGVTCVNTSSSRVVGVAVAGKNLSGYVPSELGSLAFLRRLNLHGNRLTGTVPPALANATSLHSLFLYDNRLTGPFPAAALCALPRLQNLDLSRNALSGTLPEELGRCTQLERLLLAENGLSSGIPGGVWPHMPGLQMLDLSSNNFSGPIPVELGRLPALAGTLNLSRNHLSGGVPPELGRLPATVTLDLRFNNLSGEIPQSGSLASQGPTAFLNNPGLCGFPLQVPCRAVAPSSSSLSPPPPSSSTASNGGAGGGAREPIKTSLIVLITVADAAGVALIGVTAVYVYWKVRDRRRRAANAKDKVGDDDEEEGRGLFPCLCMRADACADSSSESSEDDGRKRNDGGGGAGAGTGEAAGELVAIDKGFKMELDELLRSSAYVLGKGRRPWPCAGWAAAPRRPAVPGVRDGGGRNRAGAAPNVVRLRAYYWSADEKLVVTDFVNNGNLATALRGRSGQPSLSWSLRLRIAKGAARGLAHLHECSPRRFVHGEVKPSNILLDADYNALVADFGLTRLLTIAGCTDVYSVTGSGSIMGGAVPYEGPATLALDKSGAYRAPEARALAGCAQPPSQKCDVYSFGIVLLKLLTGRAPKHSSPSVSSSTAPFVPGHYSEKQEVSELVRWVQRGFEDARPLSELADDVVLRDTGAWKEVIAAFHVALGCIEVDPERRPRMKAVSDGLDKIGA